MSLSKSLIAEQLEQGSYYSVFSELTTLCKQTGSLDSMAADDLLLTLLTDPFFHTSVPESELEETISLLKRKGMVPERIKPSIIGCAQFPVVSPDKQEVWLHEFEAVANKNNDITNRITPETRCDLWVQLLKLQSMIQSNLSLQDGGNDTTILNFGISLKLRTPLLTTGHDPKFISQNSIQFAAIVAWFSRFSNILVDAGFVFTGAFDDDGKTIQVGDTGLKIDWIIRKRPAVKKIFIPKSDSYSPDEQLIISDNSDKIIVISDMEDLLHNAFGDSLKNLLKFSKEKLHELGAVRIITTLLGKRLIGIKHLWLDEFPPFKENEYDTIYAKMSDGEISGSNIREIYTTLPSGRKQMILLDGRFPLFWLGAYIHASKNNSRMIAIKYKKTENFIIMASAESDEELIGKQFYFKKED